MHLLDLNLPIHSFLAILFTFLVSREPYFKTYSEILYIVIDKFSIFIFIVLLIDLVPHFSFCFVLYLPLASLFLSLLSHICYVFHACFSSIYVWYLLPLRFFQEQSEMCISLIVRYKTKKVYFEIVIRTIRKCSQRECL